MYLKYFEWYENIECKYLVLGVKSMKSKPFKIRSKLIYANANQISLWYFYALKWLTLLKVTSNRKILILKWWRKERRKELKSWELWAMDSTLVEHRGNTFFTRNWRWGGCKQAQPLLKVRSPANFEILAQKWLKVWCHLQHKLVKHEH